MKQKLQKTINQVIGKSGNLSVPSWWMRKILNDIVEYCGEDKGISNSPAINSDPKIVFDLIKLGDPIETNDQWMKFSKEQFESAIEMSASEFIEKVKSGATVEIQIKPMIITNPRYMTDLTDDDDSDVLFVIYYEFENLNLLGLVINKDFSLQVGTGNMIEEFGLVTQDKLNTELNNKVPDWNALEGENGYIKNKPISVTETLIKDYTLAGRSEYKLSTNGGTISFKHLVDGEIVNESREIESFTGERFISPNGVYDFTFSNNNGDLHLITPYDPTLILNEIQLKEKYYTPLQEGFIPKTIARTQDVENAIEDLRSNIGGKTFVEITYAELVALYGSEALTAGTYYRIIDYETTTAQENTRSAGHPFDVVVLALNKSILAEEAYAVYSVRDTDGYFLQRCNISAWKLWYSLENDTQRFAWADAENGKGVIYRMIDEWNNDCPYDFKNIQFKRGVYDGGGIAPDGDEDMHIHLFTFSFRTEDNDIIDTSIFGNNGRLLNDEEQITGVYGNVIGQYMSYDYSIESPTKTTQRLNDIVFYSHYDYEGGLYYGCYSNSFGNNCYSNSFGNNCYSNSFGNNCYYNSFGNNCYYNSFGNECGANSFGNNCYYNSFGYGCYSNSFGNNCYSNRFGNSCASNSFIDQNGIADNAALNRLDDGVSSVELWHDEVNGYYGELRNHHICKGVRDMRVEIYADRDYETTYTMTSDGELREFVLGDL